MNTIGNIPATKQDVETAVENAVDKLALMINESFTTTATKDDLTALEGKLTTRLDRIEHLLLAKQEQRLNDLEARMKNLEDALAVQDTIGQHPQSPGTSRAFMYLPFTSSPSPASAWPCRMPVVW